MHLIATAVIFRIARLMHGPQRYFRIMSTDMNWYAHHRLTLRGGHFYFAEEDIFTLVLQLNVLSKAWAYSRRTLFRERERVLAHYSARSYRSKIAQKKSAMIMRYTPNATNK